MNRICADIKCPFFRSETELSIRCEGPEMQVLNTMKFPDSESKMRYSEKYCVYYPNECHIRHAAEVKWKD